MNNKTELNDIRSCLEGVIPSTIATVSADGIPNISYVSQVHYIDNQHVALSFQFFNKTRENILVNSEVMIQVINPDTGAHHRLTAKYLRTETDGPIFEMMQAGLAGIASHTGMSKVFKLLGADIYQLLSIETVDGEQLSSTLPQGNRLAALRSILQLLQHTHDFHSLIEKLLQGLQQSFEIRHGILLFFDKHGKRLYTVDSFGYPVSGIGAEIPLDVGVIGTAASERVPIRIMYLTGKYAYTRAVRDSLLSNDPNLELETEIPFAGLTAPHSQLAVPILIQQQLLGVLFLESEEDLRFTYEDEDALVVLMDCVAQRILQFGYHLPVDTENPSINLEQMASGPNCIIKHFIVNDSIFIDEEYLIKGVAGAIFWKILKCYDEEQRTEFSNRELRLDPTIGLPDIVDNLEARLILLQKRLKERCDFLQIVKSGRGRFRLQIDRAISLQEA